MVSREYPPPVPSRSARSGVLGPADDTTSVEAVRPVGGDAGGTGNLPLSETLPSSPQTRISPLRRPRQPVDDATRFERGPGHDIPAIESAALAWPTESTARRPSEHGVPAPVFKSEQTAPVSPLGDASVVTPDSLSSLADVTRSLDRAPPSFARELADLGGQPSHAPSGLVGSPLDPSSTSLVPGNTMTLERPVAEPERQALSPRFEFSSESERTHEQSWSRRMVQGAVLFALVAAVASFVVILPEKPATSVETAEPTRVLADNGPTATAELLASSNPPGVEGALADAGELRRVTAFSAAGLGTPGDSGEGFEAAVAAVIEQTGPEEVATTTTTWVEPTLPPESEWVDAGNGVLVPDLLLRIRFCESTNNYKAANSNSSARGAYQFLNKSWDWYGHAARTGVAEAHLAAPAKQDEAGLLTLQSQGTAPWRPSRDCWSSPDINPAYATARPRQAATTTTAPDQSTTTDTGDSSTSSSAPNTTAPAGSSTTDSTDQSTTTTTGASSTTTTGSTTTTTTTSTTTSSTAP